MRRVCTPLRSKGEPFSRDRPDSVETNRARSQTRMRSISNTGCKICGRSPDRDRRRDGDRDDAAPTATRVLLRTRSNDDSCSPARACPPKPWRRRERRDTSRNPAAHAAGYNGIFPWASEGFITGDAQVAAGVWHPDFTIPPCSGRLECTGSFPARRLLPGSPLASFGHP